MAEKCRIFPHNHFQFLNILKLKRIWKSKCKIDLLQENLNNSANFQHFLEIPKLTKFYYIADSKMVLLIFIGRVV